MFQPVGPLPPSVYWRRRALAGVGLVLAPVLLASGIATAATDDGAAAGPGTDAAPTAAPAALTSVVPASGLVTPPGGAAAVLDPLAGTGRPSRSAAPVTATPTTTTRSAPPPATCRDRDLEVTARTDAPRYGAGTTPMLSLVVTNTGTAPCTRDLDAARQALAVVRRPGDGVWGSNDCSPGRTRDVRTLAPGQEAVFSVSWSGRTSLPGCTGTRRPVAPGTYQVLARLDGVVSDPVRFTLDR